MSVLTPHLAWLAVVTTGVGAAMLRLGVSRGALAARAQRRCGSCGRLLRKAACERCTA